MSQTMDIGLLHGGYMACIRTVIWSPQGVYQMGEV